MSNIDTDLFSPLDQNAPASTVPDIDALEQQIDALFQVLTSMSLGNEITMRFQRPDGEAQFVMRLLGKHLP